MINICSGIMIKESVDLEGLRRATKPLMRHVLRGRGVDQEAILRSFSALPTTNRGGAMVLAPPTPKISGRLAGKILQPRGGAYANFLSEAKKTKSQELMQVLSGMSPKAKEIFNRIALLHEGSERAFAPKKLGKLFDMNSRWFSHISPSVIGQESNIIASLPKGPEYDQARRAFQAVRRVTGELDWSNRTITPQGYGISRLSRHGVRARTRDFSSKLPRIQNALMEQAQARAELLMNNMGVTKDPQALIEALRKEHPHLFGVPEF